MIKGFPDLVYEPSNDPEAIEIPPDGLSIDLLRAVYRSNRLSLHVRMRAAMACLKHEVPSLGISALVTADADWIAALDRAIARSKPKLIEATPQIESKPQIEVKAPTVHTPDRRFRRI